MKIAILYPHLTKWGGAPRTIQQLANSLVNRSNEVHVYTQKIYTHFFHFEPKVIIHSIGGPLPRSPLHWVSLPKILNKFSKFVKREGFDIIVTNNFPTNCVAAQIQKNARKPLILWLCNEPNRWLHDKEFRKQLPLRWRVPFSFVSIPFKVLDVNGARSSDVILANSRITAQQVLSIYGRSARVLYRGVVYDDFVGVRGNRLRNLLGLSGPVILSLGFSQPLKGIERLLIAFSRVLQKIPEATLIICGTLDVGQDRLFEMVVRRLRIPRSRIVSPGFVEDAVLPQYYALADVVASPSVREPMGRVPLEAMAAGKPIVASDDGGARETVVDGKTGFLVGPYDVQMLTRRLLQLIQSPIMAARFGRAGQQHVRKNFRWELTIDRFLQIIDHHLKSKA